MASAVRTPLQESHQPVQLARHILDVAVLDLPVIYVRLERRPGIVGVVHRHVRHVVLCGLEPLVPGSQIIWPVPSIISGRGMPPKASSAAWRPIPRARRRNRGRRGIGAHRAGQVPALGTFQEAQRVALGAAHTGEVLHPHRDNVHGAHDLVIGGGDEGVGDLLALGFSLLGLCEHGTAHSRHSCRGLRGMHPRFLLSHLVSIIV